MMGSSNDKDDKTTVISQEDNTLQKEMEKAKEQEACLIVIRGKPQGHRYFLTQKEMVIGRDPTADVSIPDDGISRNHARLTVAGAEVRLTDLKSRNGTFVNGKKVNPGETVVLAKEDMIKLGSSILKFLPKGELEILYYGNLGSAAHMDPLTQIYNKGYLLEALDAEFKRAKALGSDFSILFFDIDFFKKVNDTHGHDAGDYVLKEFSALIRGNYVRPKDVFARYGGEEFVILMGGMPGAEAAKHAEKIREGIEKHPFVYEGKRLPITSSIGVAEVTIDIQSAQTLLKKADQALYKAKESGRNRVESAIG